MRALSDTAVRKAKPEVRPKPDRRREPLPAGDTGRREAVAIELPSQGGGVGLRPLKDLKQPTAMMQTWGDRLDQFRAGAKILPFKAA